MNILHQLTPPQRLKVSTEQQHQAEYQQHGVVELVVLVEGPGLDLPHDLLVPVLNLHVPGPARGEDLVVGGELGGPAQVELGYDLTQVVGLDHLMVPSNLCHLNQQ